MHKSITWGPHWPEQPHTYELLIRVADAGPSIPHLSTTATVIVHLIPWSTSTVTTRTHRSPVRGGPLDLGKWGERILKGEETQFSRRNDGGRHSRGSH